MNLRILFLKIPKFSELQKLGSRMFLSMIDDGKKEFLQKLRLIFKRGILPAFLVTYEDVFSGINFCF